MNIEQKLPGVGQTPSLRLLIGEPGPSGFTSDIQVPWVPGCAIAPHIWNRLTQTGREKLIPDTMDSRHRMMLLL